MTISTPCGAWGLVCPIRAMALAVLVLVPMMPPEARGQSGTVALEIVVPKEIRIPTGADSPLPIRVLPAEAVPKQAMLLIRGLPAVVALSEGRVFESGVWSLRISDLPKLRIQVPSDARGRADLAMCVVTLEGAVMARSRSSLFFTTVSASVDSPSPPVPPQAAEQQPTAWMDPGTSPADAPAGLLPVPLPPNKSVAEIESLMLLMRRGDESMASGKVNDARLFYTRGAESGWALAALALAKTYDAQELARMAVLGGVQPNPELAAKWYRRARDLGSQEATERLQRLGLN